MNTSDTEILAGMYALVNQLPLGIAVLGQTGEFIHLNPAFTKITGYGRDDIRNSEDWFLSAYPDAAYRTQILQDWNGSLQSETVQQVFDVTCKNGQIKAIEFKAAMLPNGMALLTLNDVSKRTAAETASRESEKTIASIFKAAPTGIGMVVDRVIVRANDRLCEITGYAEGELIGRSARMLYPTEADYSFVGKEKYHQVKKKGTGTVETRWQHKSGRIMNILLSSTPLNPDDWSEGVTFTALDITEQKRLEAELKNRETRYREYFDENLSGACIVTAGGQVLDCNREYVQIFGFASKEDALETNIKALYQSKSTRQELMLRIKAHKRVERFESRMKRIDGTPIQILENAVGMFDDEGNLISIRGYLSDITEIKRMEIQLRQAQKMEAIGTLVGGISHDFNNLLQAIGGYTELLQMEKTDNHPDYRYISELRSATKRAGDLVKQLLVFSREAEVKKRAILINEEITQVRTLLEKTIPKMISIELDLAKDLWYVDADPLQIEQVLLNLGSNASDAMPDGGKIEFTTQNVIVDETSADINMGLGQGKYVLLTVADTGYGMDKFVQDKIFEPFFTTKKIGKGTGLGMASVYGIITGHSGVINCKSQVGEGTLFSIYLPAVSGDADRHEDRGQPGLKAGKETILLVDDEPAIREVASKAFKRMGYTFLEAGNGETAIEVYARNPLVIDLVILDLSMPGMGGYKCLKELLAINPGAKVLVASGYSADTTVNDCLELGAAAYIRKPYQLAGLFSYVRNLLDGKSPDEKG